MHSVCPQNFALTIGKSSYSHEYFTTIAYAKLKGGGGGDIVHYGELKNRECILAWLTNVLLPHNLSVSYPICRETAKFF